MVFEGELVIVLNSPENSEECELFARTVFEFPAATLVICNPPASLKKTVDAINKKAGEMGRSLLTAPDWAAVTELFRPDKVSYYNHRARKRLEVTKIVEPLKSDKAVCVVFGSSPGKDAEQIGLIVDLTLPRAAAVIIYAVQEGLNPAGLSPG